VTGQMAWHSDGKTLAVGYDQTVVLWDVAANRPVQEITTHKGGRLHAFVNCTGEILLTWSEGAGGSKLWHPHTCKLLLSLPNHFILSTDVHALSDGRLWGVQQHGGTHTQPWRIEPARECRTLLRHPGRQAAGEYRMTAIHKDGRLAAVG